MSVWKLQRLLLSRLQSELYVDDNYFSISDSNVLYQTTNGYRTNRSISLEHFTFYFLLVGSYGKPILIEFATFY